MLHSRAGKIPHDAVREMRSKFPTSVLPVGDKPILKSGHLSAKVGRRIIKGKWKGFEVYTLTLEERATCPRSCALFEGCYGNNMPGAKRYVAGAELEQRIILEVAMLAVRHPGGFAVRLHVLGDFYSAEYVKLWAMLLREHAALHVFGFTARWREPDSIAAELRKLSRDEPRFAIRFSGAPYEAMTSVVVSSALDIPRGFIGCPQQTGKTQCCSTCALCWQSVKGIAFIEH